MGVHLCRLSWSRNYSIVRGIDLRVFTFNNVFWFYFVHLSVLLFYTFSVIFNSSLLLVFRCEKNILFASVSFLFRNSYLNQMYSVIIISYKILRLSSTWNAFISSGAFLMRSKRRANNTGVVIVTYSSVIGLFSHSIFMTNRSRTREDVLLRGLCVCAKKMQSAWKFSEGKHHC